jgi:membrane protease subunit HflC
MKSKKIMVVFLIVLAVLTYASSYIVYEGRQVVITQFGRPVKSVRNAGLHFKLPFIQKVRRIDLRILSWDGFPNQIPTKDKKYIEVDTTARWKIIDPLKFIQTVQDETGARSRLDAILDGVTRDVISGHNLVEAVRNSNTILDVIEEKKKSNASKEEKVSQKGLGQLQDEITVEVEPIKIGRERLSELIIESAKKELVSLGINLIDVQLKRISYEKSVQQKVYGRMISERERIAEKIISFGNGERAKIEGKTDKDLKAIESNAYKKVQEIKGQAEAESIEIYAKSLKEGPDFYRFVRSLEAYKNYLPKESRLIMSSQTKFWKVLKTGQ